MDIIQTLVAMLINENIANFNLEVSKAEEEIELSYTKNDLSVVVYIATDATGEDFYSSVKAQFAGEKKRAAELRSSRSLCTFLDGLNQFAD